jgi:uncharacterized coiled-coil protein SlyX
MDPKFIIEKQNVIINILEERVALLQERIRIQEKTIDVISDRVDLKDVVLKLVVD